MPPQRWTAHLAQVVTCVFIAGLLALILLLTLVMLLRLNLSQCAARHAVEWNQAMHCTKPYNSNKTMVPVRCQMPCCRGQA